MITRIVKLTFRPEETDRFLQIFEESRMAIGSFPGQVDLTLLRDRNQDHVFFTISIWQDETALDAYRNSPLFATVWAQTKALFAEKAEAWSLDELQNKSTWQ
ncbi:MAG: antibiotic biosynthesis monooxygenase [Saprospiraceae bacterium]|jgi:quinol monooxygenase YgiN|nr:antibiotic biosynthesis monooxygenase [Saprospiraceae bacterium]